jgi:glycosyltransferase involved in cell wall biosynthesis/peptidoglycan/xylan/chitin deacetylase (PgdA/CDA1 family)
MLVNDVYYQAKPFIPWPVRIGLRRLRARYKRATSANVWPIDEQAGSTPASWPGWPDGKRFAVVLTHDVESEKGCARVRQLMDLELKYGFKSSFYFVPEGHQTCEGMRDTVAGAGFELGVHGLEHDGKLYGSKRIFAAKAVRIREYLQRWNAVGFRSPFMQHRLGWLHQLGVQYDASTFDADPFEPEADGMRTIFPFWVPDVSGGGYVELPYTLIQDFNLFIVLRERNIDVWTKKLDWIAEHGGMALLNTHPDYMCFEGTRARDEYPVRYYEEFLSYIREKYEGQFWSGVARDVNQHYRASAPVSLRNTRRRICMVAYAGYAVDNRVRRYAETLARQGDKVDVIAVSCSGEQVGVEEMNGVTVHKVQGPKVNEHKAWRYAYNALRFFMKSSALLARLHARNRYDLIHVHNMPDFLVFSAWYPKLAGAKVILDIHDIVPELFVSKFKGNKNGVVCAVLRQLEKASAAFSDHVIVSNDIWHKKLISRSVAEAKCSVVLNHVDPVIFYRRPRTRNDGKVVVIFHGSFQRHQGLDIAVEAFARIRTTVPNAELHLYGDLGTSAAADLGRLAQSLGLNGNLKVHDRVPIDKIPDIIANADIGVVPKRADSFGNEAYSTKIMEFMSQGVPVVISRTAIDSFYFDDTAVRFFPSGNSQAMANAMLDVLHDERLRTTLIAKGLEYVERNCWERHKCGYLNLVTSLTTEDFGSLPPETVASSQRAPTPEPENLR